MEKKTRRSIPLTTQILVAAIGGIAFGAVVGPWASNLKFIGDIFIRLIQMSVVLLVMSAVAGAVGAGLADALSGVPIWVPASVIIKALITLAFTNKTKKIINLRNIIAIVAAIAVTCVGYYVYEGIIYGNWAAALAGIVPNIIQVVANGVVFILVGLALDAAGFKTKVLKSGR